MASLNLQEKANFTRLTRLLVDKGCEALRKTFDSINPPASLKTILNAQKSTLLKLPKGIISDIQWDLLFPSSGNPPDSKTFDITLLTVLLRNICGLHPPSTGWNDMPPNADNSPVANIIRIKLLRNKVYAHVSATEADNATFENLWQNVSDAMVALKIPAKEIDDLKTCPLSPKEEMYMQRLIEWYLKDEYCKNTLDDLTTNVKSIQAQLQQQDDCLQDLLNTTAETFHATQRMSHESTVHPQNTELHSGENELQNLAKHNFKSKIRSKVKLFHPETREWLYSKVESWFSKEDESRILLIKAGPGFGKSVFAAKVCKIFKESDKFAACHFCDYSDSNLKDPMTMMQSLASHMTENIPGFKEKLVDQLRRPHEVKSLKDAFQIYLQNPLDEIEVKPRLIVIDGLDESTTENKSEMVKLICDHFPDLPKCVKVLITSRPEISLNTLEDIPSVEIQRKNEACDSDLLKYLKDKLPRLAPRDAQNNAQTEHTAIQNFSVLPSIVKKCEGSFLYAFHVQKELNKREDLESIRVEEIMLLLPKGMGSVYEEYFHRLDGELEAILKKKPDLFKLLELLVAANKFVPLNFVARALGLDLDCRETVKIINKVNDAVSCVLHVSNEEVTVFHKSVFDWLLLTRRDVHQYRVTTSDGKRRLWLLCKEIYLEIKSDVKAGRELKPTKEVIYALEYGHHFLVACDMKESFHWLVDMIVVHVFLTLYPQSAAALYFCWSSALRDEDLNYQLRQRISWHYTEIRSMTLETTNSKFQYLEYVLDYSPQNCFSDDERETAKYLLGKCNRYVKLYSARKKALKLFLAKCFPLPIKAIGLSSSKKLAAVALQDGTIHVVSLPELVQLFEHQTDCKNISCCTFTPDDSVVLYGKLEIGLSVSERKKISFFTGKVEAFESCAFSPNGRRLVTNDGSCTVKLWDVSRRSLLLCLDADVPLKSCSFSKTGLFIIGDSKDAKEDSYCVWNAITFQRDDLRSLCRSTNETKDGIQRSEKCNRCVDRAHKELTPLKVLETSTGIYNGMECIFSSDDRASLFVIESTHYTSLAAWRHCIFAFPFRTKPVITMINDNLWFVAGNPDLFVFSTEQPEETQSCLSLPTLVVWCSFSPDGTRIATYTSDGFINLWNVDSCQVYERFRNSSDMSSGACWWSTEYLFVCHLQDGVPNLSKYPVDEDFDIKITRNISVSLLPIISDLSPLSGIQEFSEGYISFACDEISPVKVVNVDQMECPAMVSLPEITSTMSIVVSPGASLILGLDVACKCVIVWKRYEAYPLSYLVHMRFSARVNSSEICCFSDDLKFAYLLTILDIRCIYVDLVNKTYQSRVHRADYIPYYSLGRVFFTKGILVIVTSRLIDIVDSNKLKSLQTIYPRNFTDNSVLNSKLSPNGNILAVPTVTGDMDFFQIFHSGSS